MAEKHLSHSELIERLKSQAEEVRRLCAELDEQAIARPGRHADYPSYDVHFCMEYMGHHEAHHMYQMFERRAALARPTV